MHSLEDSGVVSPVRDARVPKYEHRIRTVLNLRRDETAVLCLLLLRGPQTPGELRGRADRMYSFDDIAAVQSTLERLASRGSDAPSGTATLGTGSISEPLVVMLPRQPGSRESRYAHLLGGPVAASLPARPFSAQAPQNASTDHTRAAPADSRLAERLQQLEDAVRQLRSRVEALEAASPAPAPPLGPPGPEG